MKITAEIKFETTVDTTWFDSDVDLSDPQRLMEELVSQGLNQYLKDFDDQARYCVPQVTVTGVDKRDDID